MDWNKTLRQEQGQMGLMKKAGLDDIGVWIYIEDFGLYPRNDGHPLTTLVG